MVQQADQRARIAGLGLGSAHVVRRAGERGLCGGLLGFRFLPARHEGHDLAERARDGNPEEEDAEENRNPAMKLAHDEVPFAIANYSQLDRYVVIFF